MKSVHFIPKLNHKYWIHMSLLHSLDPIDFHCARPSLFLFGINAPIYLKTDACDLAQIQRFSVRHLPSSVVGLKLGQRQLDFLQFIRFGL